MQWEELTFEQQAVVNAWMTQLLRPVAGELARVLYHLNVTKASYVGPSDVVGIVGSLDATAVIPNSGGLAGAVPVTKAQLTPMLAALAALLTGYYTAEDLERYIALAGATNVIGG